MEIELVKCRFDQIADKYPDLHAQVFEKADPAHEPAVVFLVFRAQNGEQEYIGFFSGYYHDAVSLYIQRMGIPRSQRGKRNVLGILPAITRELAVQGHKFLLAAIEAKNRPAIMLALRDGWDIHGVRTDTAGVLYVEMIKELSDI